jgi:NADPH-dependent ferric siderophore reductase
MCLNFSTRAAPKPKIIWEGDGAAGLPLPYFREMQVVAVSERNAAHASRIRLKGDNLFRFSQYRSSYPPAVSSGRVLPNRNGPVSGEDGRPVWPDGEAKLATRVYTIRNIDSEAGWVDIDMVVHGDDCDAPGSGWAMSAPSRAILSG